MYLLQQWYNFPDSQAQEALDDIKRMRRFAGVQPADGKEPAELEQRSSGLTCVQFLERKSEGKVASWLAQANCALVTCPDVPVWGPFHPTGLSAPLLPECQRSRPLRDGSVTCSNSATCSARGGAWCLPSSDRSPPEDR
jgi:hypothetical protein